MSKHSSGGRDLYRVHGKNYSVSLSFMSNKKYLVVLVDEKTRRTTGEANCKLYHYRYKAEAIAKYEALVDTYVREEVAKRGVK